MAAAEVRFRHTAGDIGPFQFPLASPISALKDKLFAEWPTGELGHRLQTLLQASAKPRMWASVGSFQREQETTVPRDAAG